MAVLGHHTARVITKSSYDASSSILLEKLHWGNLSLRRKKHKSILVYKTINNLTPEYLQNLFSVVGAMPVLSHFEKLKIL
jgi:hypothetical protein